jgi:hypothetical protein
LRPLGLLALLCGMALFLKCCAAFTDLLYSRM